MPHKLSFTLLLLALYGCCLAQSDSTYIGGNEHKMMLKAFVARNGLMIGHDKKDYLPNNPSRLGIGISVKNTVINLGYSFGLFPGVKEYGSTRSFDFQLHNYGRKWLFDLYYQKYKGFYYEGDTVELYPETSAQAIGGEMTYVFNNRRFSAKAAFDQSEKQLQSAGSWLLGGGVYHFKLGLRDIGDTGDVSIKNVQLGVNGGYGYSWVINKYWLMSGMVTAGINTGNDTDELKDGKLKLYPTAFARGAAEYRREDWGLSFSFLINNKMVYHSGNDFEITSLTMQLTYVKYLDGFWKKK